MNRWMRHLYAISSGGITLGIVTAAGGIRWDLILTQFLSTWLSALVSILFGGGSSLLNLINQQNQLGGIG